MYGKIIYTDNELIHIAATWKVCAMEERGHEDMLERVLLGALTHLDLAGAAEEAGVTPLTDRGGDAVGVDNVVSLDAAGFMTTNCGVNVRLSDGSEFVIEIKQYQQSHD